MLVSDVMRSASIDACSISPRTRSWRRLRQSLGACDMNGEEPLLEDGNFPARAVAVLGIAGCGQRARQLFDGTLQLRIVRRKLQRRFVARNRLGQRAALVMNVGETAD